MGFRQTVSLVCFSTGTAWFWRKFKRRDRTIGVLTGIWAFCVVFGPVFRAVRAARAGGVLVVVFHTELWQPWRASIFSVLLASVALTLTADEDCKGLRAFWNKPLFCNLMLRCYFYSLLFLFESGKNGCDIANVNLIVHLKVTTFLHIELVCLHCVVHNLLIFSSLNLIFLILHVMTQLQLIACGLIRGLYWKTYVGYLTYCSSTCHFFRLYLTYRCI